MDEIRAVSAGTAGMEDQGGRASGPQDGDRKAWVLAKTGEIMSGGVSRGPGTYLGLETYPF